MINKRITIKMSDNINELNEKVNEHLAWLEKYGREILNVSFVNYGELCGCLIYYQFNSR